MSSSSLRLFILVTLLLPSVVQAHSDCPFKPTVYGSWSLCPIDDFQFPSEGKHRTVHGACVAETIRGKFKLAIAVPSKEFNRGNDEYADRAMVVVTSTSWNFKVHISQLFLSSDAYPKLTLGVGAWYDDDMLFFVLGGHGTPSSELNAFAQTASGYIKLFDKKSRVLAEFPSEGLREVYPKLLECGGIQ